MKLKKYSLLNFKNAKYAYPLCNLCGRIADWLILFHDKKDGKIYVTTRCYECLRKPEPQLNNKISYSNIPLWYGAWTEILSRLPPNVILLHNSFEEQDE